MRSAQIAPPPNTPSGNAASQAELRKLQVATRVAFFVAGVSVAAWAPLVPYAKHRLAIEDGMLGLLLLCLGAGSVGCMPVCNRLIQRFGCRRMICTGVMLVCLALPLLAFVSSVGVMAMALLVFGAGMGFLDVAMNVHAMLVERAAGRQLMSGFHGLYSVGGIAGSVAGGALLSFGAPPVMVAVAVVIMAGLLVFRYAPDLLRDGTRGPRAKFTLPHGIVIVMGLIGLCVFLVEGAMLDWSALFLTTEKSYPQRLAGFGYTGFSLAMTIGRLLGDRVAHRFGPGRTVIAGAVLGAAGLTIAIAGPTGGIAIAGFALAGLGCANIVPVLFATAGRQKAMEPGAAIAALTTLGYGGNLVGPAAIGFVSHAVGLSISFALLAVLLLFAAAGSRVLFR